MPRAHVKGVGLGRHVAQGKNHHFSCGRSGHQSKGYCAFKRVYLIFALWFVGGDNFSRQISQTRSPIFGSSGEQHRNRRRGGLEKVPKDLCSSLLGGMYRAVKVAIFSMRSLEKHLAGMGRNRPHRVRPLR